MVGSEELSNRGVEGVVPGEPDLGAALRRTSRISVAMVATVAIGLAWRRFAARVVLTRGVKTYR
jgi:hypothetical protein